MEDYKSAYLNSEVHSMVHEERRQDLKNMFYLLNGIPGALDVLLEEFELRIKSQGREREGKREREREGKEKEGRGRGREG